MSVEILETDYLVVGSAPLCSAALAAHLEATREDLADKNRFAVPIPYPEREADWVRNILANMMHDFICRSDREVRDWISRCRMNPGAATAAAARPDGEWKRHAQRIRDHAPAAAAKLQQFQTQLDATG